MVHPAVQAAAVGGGFLVVSTHLLGRAMIKSAGRVGIETLRDRRRRGFKVVVSSSPTRVLGVKPDKGWAHGVRRFLVGPACMKEVELQQQQQQGKQ